MAFYELKGNEVVPFKGEVPDMAIEAIERADTEAIVQALATGFGAEHYLYSFEVSGREIIGIGWDGAKQIAHMVGNLEVLPDIKVEERDDAFYGAVRVRDLLRNVTLMGIARQSKTKHLKSGEDKPDEHALTVALNKAQRNAVLNVVTPEVKLRVIQEFVQGRRKLAPPPRKEIIDVKPKAEEAKPAQPKAEPAAKPAETPKPKAEEVKPTPPPSWKDLGYSSLEEQGKLRTELWKALKGTEDEKREWFKVKDVTSTMNITREKLLALVMQAKSEEEELF